MISDETIPPIAWPDVAGLDVWRIHLALLGDDIDGLKVHLAPEELDKAGRFHFDRDRRRYTIAHAALRFILAAYLRCRPAEVVILSGPQGKPILANPNGPHGLTFNLSHSGEQALLGVGRQRYIGVDIEQARAMADPHALAGSVFSESELSSFAALNPAEQLDRFFNLWTCKEAAVKAWGAGLAVPLPEVQIEPRELTETARFQAIGAMPEGQPLYGISLRPMADYHAAVVTEVADFQVIWRDWPGPA